MSSHDMRDLLKSSLLRIEELESELEMSKEAQAQPIAIVGIGCRFPGSAASPEDFWKLLEAGVDAVREIPPERLPLDAAARRFTESRWAGLLDSVDGFDAEFFGISPREALSLDPQQRLLLEVAWEALEDAAIPAAELEGTATGAFIGICWEDYQHLLAAAQDLRHDAYCVTGNMKSIAAGRISYTLGLQGPCAAVDTACSSSLVAVHLACQSLRSGESTLALAGGVNLILSPRKIGELLALQTFSPSGRCRTFDAGANGMVRGEGCGVVVLKRLSQALRDGNQILAVIRGTAINQDGRSTGLTAPNVLAQESLLRQALRNARLSPAEIQYVEAHGTGTSLGDPIEVEALKAVLGAPQESGTPCALGSVKTNIGHLEAAAGIAGLIKVVLSLQHQTIPRHLNFRALNPRISLDGTRFVIPTSPLPWPASTDTDPRRAGVSSFGLSGTNAHVVLEEAPGQPPVPAASIEQPLHLLPLSARNPEALRELAARFSAHLAAHPEQHFSDVCWTAGAGRSHMYERAAILAASAEEARAQLQLLAEDGSPAGALPLRGRSERSHRPQVAFLFTGQGAQYPGMGHELYQTQPVFRAALDRCAEILAPLLSRPLLSILWPRASESSPDSALLDETEYTQPALFALAHALGELWRSWGVVPAAVLGHSVGEYAAACMAGVFSLEQGLRLLVERGRLMQSLQQSGRMVSVRAEVRRVELALARYRQQVSIAALNGPEHVVISGGREAVGAICAELHAEGIKTTDLVVSHAFHSPLMEPILDRLEAAAHKVELREPQLTLISNVSGTAVRKEVTTAAYWRTHTREAVRFADSVQALRARGIDTLIEIGPHPTLLGLAATCPGSGSSAMLPSLRRGKEDSQVMMESLGRLYVQGAQIDWRGAAAPHQGRAVRLPTYPFQRQRFWVQPAAGAQSSPELPPQPAAYPLSGRTHEQPGASSLHQIIPLSLERQPYLADHGVYGQTVIAGTFYLAVLLAVAVQRFAATAVTLRDIRFVQPLLFKEEVELHAELTPRQEGGFTACLYTLADADPSGARRRRIHAEGQLHLSAAPQEAGPSLFEHKQECASGRQLEEIYAHIGMYFDWGPRWRWTKSFFSGPGAALAQLELSAGSMHRQAPIHPTLLDNCFAVAVDALGTSGAQADGTSYPPWALEELRWYGRAAEAGWCHGRWRPRTSAGNETVVSDLVLYGEDGEVVASMSGMVLKRAPKGAFFSALSGAQAASPALLELSWQAEAAGAVGGRSEPAGRWLIVAHNARGSEALCRYLHLAGCSWTLGLAASGAALVSLDENTWSFDPARGEQADALVKAASVQGPLAGIVLWQGEESAAPDSVDCVADFAERAAVAGLHVLQALLRHLEASRPRLWIVTHGAQAVEDSAAVSAASAPLWGLGRVLMKEHPELRCTLVDLSPRAESAAAELWQELCRDDDETQVAMRAGIRHVARLRKALAVEPGVASPLRNLATGAVLITGGLGALGLHLASWLVMERGARHLVLTSRREPSVEQQARIEVLRRTGASVRVVSADVADSAQVQKLLASMADGVPLCGVIHAAGLLHDGMLSGITASQLIEVIRPKVRGAWNLHEQTRGLSLQFFVMFSSVASLLGSAGQGSYAAGNAFLDALAYQRRGEGYRSLSVNWGPWADGGMAARLDGTQQARLLRQGFGMLSTSQSLGLLEQALSHRQAGLAALSLEPEMLRPSPGSLALPIWRALVQLPRPAAASAEVAKGTSAGLRALDASALALRIEAMVRTAVTQVLSLPQSSRIAPDRALRELGLDSLMAVELRNALAAQIGETLPATLAFDFPTVGDLVRHLLEKLLPKQQPEPSTAVQAQQSDASDVDDPIAIIGIGCRYPGGVTDSESFWQLLTDKVDAIREVPPDRWDVGALYSADPDAPGKIMTRFGGFLEQIQGFDPGFFGIPPSEAAKMDPQQRLLLEVTWEALAHAGLPAESLMNSETGVFLGQMYQEYELLGGAALHNLDAYAGLGSAGSVASGRISYLLGLKGPSLTVDTACSSSLVTIHLACQSLWAGECAMALAGGVTLTLTPNLHVWFSRLRGLAPDGRSKAFDAAADGVSLSEGCGMVVLKRLSDAQRAGDRILALIRGTAVNQDGRSNGLTAPNGPSQEAVIRRALARGKVLPAAVGYVEAHGTGTALGDPIELQAMGAVYREGRPTERPLLVGAVKTNFGHAQAAAGVAGLIKAALVLQHRQIPPNLHFQNRSPHIPWDSLPISVPSSLTPWPESGAPYLAAVSSFGISGTNAHAVLEAAPPEDPAAHAVQQEEPCLLPLSAQSASALQSLSRSYPTFLRTAAASLSEIAYTASVRRSHYQHRLACIGESRAEIAEALELYMHHGEAAGVVSGQVTGEQPKIIFVFPGQGSQWVGMGRELLQSEPVFRSAILALDEAIRREAGFSIITSIQADEASAQLDRIDIIQPILFAIEVGLAKLWRSWGVEPDIVVGHSMGEIAAAHVAGALSVTDAVAIICRRSRMLSRFRGTGALVALAMGPEAARQLVRGYEGRLAVAVHNGPQSTVIGGDKDAMAEITARLDEQRIYWRGVRADLATHTPQMAALREELVASLAGLEPAKASLTMISTVTAGPVSGEELHPDYWHQNMQQPVLFSQVVGRLAQEGAPIFIELSPHPILLPFIQESLAEPGRRGMAFGSLRRNAPERKTLLMGLAQLYVRGYPVNWNGLQQRSQRVVSLPAYPWQREHYWLEYGQKPWVAAEDQPRLRSRQLGKTEHPLLGEGRPVAGVSGVWMWEQTFAADRPAYLADHRVQDEVVFPGAGYIEMALAAGAKVYGGTELELRDVHFEALLPLAPKIEVTVQVTLTQQAAGEGRLIVAGRDTREDIWREHANAYVQVGRSSSATSNAEELEAVRRRLPVRIEAAQIYATTARQGANYGALFQGVKEIWQGDGESLGRVEALQDDSGYLIHPAVLDACLQVGAWCAARAGEELDGQGPWVPVRIRQLRCHSKLGRQLWVRASRCEHGERSFDLTLYSDNGDVLMTLEGCELTRLEGQSNATQDSLSGCIYAVEWREEKSVEKKEGKEKQKRASWAVVEQRGGLLGAAVAEQLRQDGRRCVVIKRADGQGQEALEKWLREEGEAGGIIYVGMGDKSLRDGASGEEVAETAKRACMGLVDVIKAVVRAEKRDVPRVYVLMRGSQSVAGEDVDVVQAGLWGLGRAISVEHPEVRCKRIDLEPNLETRAEVHAVMEELARDDAEDQVARRGNRRYLARLVRSTLDRPEAAPRKPELAGKRPFILESSAPGMLENLCLRELVRRPPGPDEVEIEVEAAGLNFLDVMKAMAIYPGMAPGAAILGGECAGTVVAVGEHVTDFKLGQRVLTFAPRAGAMSSHITAPARLVAAIPGELTFAQAATVPVVFITIWYALHHVGRARKGERILIHSASGGTGLAAIQFARAMGLEVFATAGSDEKRAYLRSLGIKHVMDSRSVDFAAQIMRETGGRGVDLVLNSLIGEALHKSLEVLAPYGRFLELGKRIFFNHSRLDLAAFRKGVSYCAIDPVGIAEEQPELFSSLLAEVMSLFAQGTFQPLPLREFRISESEQAFRLMAQAQHIGKLALVMKDDKACILPRAASASLIDATASYIISGGLGGLGRTIGRWLVEKGARKIVLLGRTEPGAEARRDIAEMHQAGAEVRVKRMDIAKAAEVQRMVEEVEREVGKVKGVVHAAVELADQTLLEMKDEHFERVFAGKVSGGWNLHQSLKDKELDFFVLYSSVASLLGSPGQANYTAGNCMLDGLAHHRRSQGLPGLSIQWGAFAEVGGAAAAKNRGERLSYRGIASLKPEEGNRALERLLRSSQVEVGVVRFNLRQWIEFYPRLAGTPYLAELQSAAADTVQGDAASQRLQRQLAQAEPAHRIAQLEAHLKEQLGKVLHLEVGRIDRSIGFKSLGVDSLMALEYRNRLEGSLGLKLTATLLFTYPNLVSLAEFLLERMGLAARPEPAEEAPEELRLDAEGSLDVQQLQQLSSEETEDLLEDKLASLAELLK